jgi:hypothetical protein
MPMEKRKKKKTRPRRIFGLTIGEICAIATFAITIVGFIITAVHYLDSKFASIDRRFDQVDGRLDKIETRLDGIDHRLDNLEIELRKTSDLLDMYLTWRFIYVNDPMKKNLIPVYDPRTRTLEFVKRTY